MSLNKTALHQQHVESKGKLVPFAGFEMPIQYSEGIISEHEQVRNRAGLFDVSHMGQVSFSGNEVAEFLSKITPSNFAKLKDGGCKYTVLTNKQGGIIDDLIITRFSENEFGAVINAACVAKDVNWIRSHLPEGIKFEVLNKSLLALQGPKAESALDEITKVNLSEQKYMTSQFAEIEDIGECQITRTGYTGEDGFEISVDNEWAPKLWDRLLSNPDVKPTGLGARDILRLEMGYPLYGHDMNDQTTPVEAGLGWVISKEHNGFYGDSKINQQKSDIASVPVKRLGLKIKDRAVAREGAEIYIGDKKVGNITSGGFSPALKAPIAHGYINRENAELGSTVQVKVRNKVYDAELVNFPFIEAVTKK